MTPTAIHTLFSISAGKKHIAIFIIVRLVCVFTIDAIGSYQGKMRHYSSKFFILFKKRFTEIKIPPIGKFVPGIRFPISLIVDRKRRIWTVNGNDVFSGSIALSFIKIVFVST